MHILNSTQVRLSVRRLKKEGRFIFILKALLTASHRSLPGEVRDNAITYEFGNLTPKKKRSLMQWLHKLKKFLLGLDLIYRRLLNYLEIKWNL